MKCESDPIIRQVELNAEKDARCIQQRAAEIEIIE
jgi:hypothetical protein